MKLAVLCSTRLAIPALQQLLQQQLVTTIGVPENKDEIFHMLSQLAVQYNIPVTVFARKKFGEQLNNWLQEQLPDAVLVMTFPFRIPAAVLSVPRHGFINFHYGLLPQMRGADPVFETIRRRKPMAGVSVHVMDEGFDTGAIILRREEPCQPGYTYGLLSARLAYTAVDMCAQLVTMLAGGGPLPATVQNEADAAYYPAVSRTELTADWANMDAATLLALIQACNPILKTGVQAWIGQWSLGICDATIVNVSGDASAYPPGAILAVDPQNGLLVMTKDGLALKLEVVYTEEGYFPGYKLAIIGIKPGMRFTLAAQ